MILWKQMGSPHLEAVSKGVGDDDPAFPIFVPISPPAALMTEQ
jgi:hypothetical protein